MGVNAMRISYFTGYEEFAETDEHDFWALMKVHRGAHGTSGDDDVS